MTQRGPLLDQSMKNRDRLGHISLFGSRHLGMDNSSNIQTYRFDCNKRMAAERYLG